MTATTRIKTYPHSPLGAVLKPLGFAALLALTPMLAHSAPASDSSNAAKAVAVQSAKVNINTASIEALTALNGVGVAKARAIVDYRTKFGRFQSADDLMAVEGIGTATLAKNRARIEL